MSEPRRLIETESGRARELLDVGLSERAPARVRARVSSSVSAVVAGLDLGAASPSPTGSEQWVGHEGTAPTGLSTGTPGGVLTKLVGSASVDSASVGSASVGSASVGSALKLSAVIAALGAGGLVYHQVQRSEHGLAAAATVSASAPSRGADESALPLSLRPAPSGDILAPAGVPGATQRAPTLEREPAAQQAPARTKASTRQPARREPAVTAQKSAESSRPEAAAHAVGPPEVSGDTLAQELALIARARARLQAREPRLARELLDEYARRFPRGALAPEARSLAERARTLDATSAR
ncbi:MAG: hypothetical protein ABW217_19085 [Polyangiaceae bacterium]